MLCVDGQLPWWLGLGLYRQNYQYHVKKKQTEKTEKCQSCFYYSCHAVEFITLKMSLQKHSLKINPPNITKKVETSFTLN
jgi:hypothetical protein